VMICLRGVQLIQRVLVFILWMCGLGFAQEEKNELGLLLGAEFIPQATTTSGNRLSLGRSIAYAVDHPRRLSSGNTTFFLEFPFAAAPSHTPAAKRPLMKMEKRMLHCLAGDERQCQDRSQEGYGKGEFLTGRHWPLSPSSGRPVSGTPCVPQDHQHNNRGGSRNE
jgi:hypothetical protein